MGSLCQLLLFINLLSVFFSWLFVFAQSMSWFQIFWKKKKRKGIITAAPWFKQLLGGGTPLSSGHHYSDWVRCFYWNNQILWILPRDVYKTSVKCKFCNSPCSFNSLSNNGPMKFFLFLLSDCFLKLFRWWKSRLTDLIVLSPSVLYNLICARNSLIKYKSWTIWPCWNNKAQFTYIERPICINGKQ